MSLYIQNIFFKKLHVRKAIKSLSFSRRSNKGALFVKNIYLSYHEYVLTYTSNQVNNETDFLIASCKILINLNKTKENTQDVFDFSVPT